MAKEPTGASSVARFGLIGNVTVPVSTGSFVQVFSTDNRSDGTLKIAAQANIVIRYPVATGTAGTDFTEMTFISSWGEINLGDVDPTKVWVRSAGSATTLAAWYS
jgi:hypothetical protein